MSTAPDDSGIVQPLRVGLIADAEGARRLQPTLAVAPLTVLGQCGMHQADGLPGAPWFDDARVMLAQEGLAAVLVVADLRATSAAEAHAAERNLPLWRPPPLARGVAEACELITRVRRRGGTYWVASWWECVRDDVRQALALAGGAAPTYTRARISAAGPAAPSSWPAGAGDAPGGVLLTDGYPLLEALVGLQNLPERVTARIGHLRRRPDEPWRNTESLAVALLSYDDGATALVEAVWDIPPFGHSLHCHGPQATLLLEPGRVVVTHADGRTLAERPLPGDDYLRTDLTRFADAVERRRVSAAQDVSLERHLAVLALIQSIHLAARTGQPESPRKFYEVQGWPPPRA